MYKIYVGNISAERKRNWYLADENPYALWEGKPLVKEICTGGLWCIADELLRCPVDVDWGSKAWKGSKEEITALFEAGSLNLTALEPLNEQEEYAVVFLETVWGDSA